MRNRKLEAAGRRALAGLLLLLSGLSLGCEDEVTAPPAAAPRRAPAAAEKVEEKKIPAREVAKEADFVESETNRDPFRSFAKTFVEEARGQMKSQREVVLEQYAIDELKLIGIITGAKPERAMFVDPTGLGHVVVRGQFIGRASIVPAAGGVGSGYEVNWRVDRIRDGDVILVRDDPSNPEVPASTRVVPIRADELESLTPNEEPPKVEDQLSELKQRIQSMEAASQASKRGEQP